MPIQRTYIMLSPAETFRAKTLSAFASGHVYCDCAGFTHDEACPLGELELEAEALRAETRAQHESEARAMSERVRRVAWCPDCQGEADYDMHPIYAGGRIPPVGSNEGAVDWQARCTTCYAVIQWRETAESEARSDA